MKRFSLLLFFLAITLPAFGEAPVREKGVTDGWGEYLKDSVVTLASESSQAPLFDLQKELEGYRGLPFKQPVVWRSLTKEETLEVLEGSVEEWYTPERLLFESHTLKLLGWVPVDLDLKGSWLSLFEEQVLGAYVPEKDFFFMVPLTPDSLGYGMKDRQFKSFVLHELDHALTDQYAKLDLLMGEASKISSDRGMALKAVVEGDATMVMYDFLMGRRLQDLGINVWDMGRLPNLSMMWGESLGSLPQYFKMQALFPYIGGAHYMFSQREQFPDDDLMSRYHKIRTTEEIMHPSWSSQELKTGLVQPTLKLDLKEGETLLGEDTMGEFGVRFLLEEWENSNSEYAADGWGIDHLYLVRRAGGEEQVRWFISWDSEVEVEEFVHYVAQDLPSGWKMKQKGITTVLETPWMTLKP